MGEPQPRAGENSPRRLCRFSVPKWVFIPFPIFWIFLKAAGRKASLSSAMTLPSMKLTPKGLDYTQIGPDFTRAVRLYHCTILWFWNVLGQSQNWLRAMQTDLWKTSKLILAYLNSRQPVRKTKSCAWSLCVHFCSEGCSPFLADESWAPEFLSFLW